MRKNFKLLGIVILVSIFLFISKIIYTDYKSTVIEGVVFDCETSQPIAGANLRIPKQMTFLDTVTFQWGGGENYYATTDQSGKFSLKYKGDYFNVHITKEGYLDASEYGKTGAVRIGILKRTSTDDAFEYSRACKRSSECLETKEVNGVMTTRDKCSPVLNDSLW